MPDGTPAYQDVVDALRGAPGGTAPMGTLCAGCHARGFWTMHSPAGQEHAGWEARWADDPDWQPEGLYRSPLFLPRPDDEVIRG